MLYPHIWDLQLLHCLYLPLSLSNSQINVVVVLPHCLDRSISALYYVFMDGPTSCCVTTDQSRDPEPLC